LIEIRTRHVKFTFKTAVNPKTKELNRYLRDANKAVISPIKVRAAGIKPVPRCDHSAQLISKNRYMLIYGGRNELAFKNNGNVYLDDIMLFDFGNQ